MLTLHALLFAQAVECEQGGDLATAEQLYRRCLGEQPGDPQALLRLGLTVHRSGRPDEALLWLGQAARAEPQAADRLGLFATALARRGRHAEAAAAFRQCIALQPAPFDPYLALGNALLDLAQPAAAAVAYRRATALAPDLAEPHFQLANSLALQGDPAGAARHYRHAAGLDPASAKAFSGLGGALQRQGRTDEAVAACRWALRLAPDSPDGLRVAAAALLSRAPATTEQSATAEEICRRTVTLSPEQATGYLGLAACLVSRKRFGEAARLYRRASAIDPGLAEAFANLGLALREQERTTDGLACCRRAIALAPDSPLGYTALGAILRDGDDPEAEAVHRRAATLDPADADSVFFLGQAARRRGDFAGTVAACRRTIAIAPALPRPYVDLGDSLYALGRGTEAVAACRRAIYLAAAAPDDRSAMPQAHFNLALGLLLSGALADGFREYQWRWEVPNLPLRRRDFPAPLWDGRPFGGQTLLLHAEQGFGDTIQFCRYLPEVAARGGSVLLECPAPLTDLMRQLPAAVTVIEAGTPLPPFDLHLPLMSLPVACGISEATLAAAVPYLQPDAGRRERWQARIRPGGGPKIGLVWAGNAQHGNDRRRSIALAQFAGVAWPAAAALYSLQKGNGEDQLAGWSGPLPIVPLGEQIRDFADLAAAIAAVDLVITVDSAPAHLAGALGKPVWTLLPFAPDWRWMLERTDSPWYPTMRLFRQTRPGDWAGVMQAVEAALAEAFAC